MSVSLELLTDEAILDYTRGEDGIDRVITVPQDLNLRCDYPKPIAGGVYDTEIFGSPLIDRCICNHTKQPSKEPCPKCGCRVFTREESLRRFARIELPFYYLNDLRFDVFKELFYDIFSGSTITYNFVGDMKANGYTTAKGTSKPSIKLFDTCQFEYFKTKKELVITDIITDEKKCSYEGLMEIIKKYFPGRLSEYMQLINRYYLVQPSSMRPFTLAWKNGEKKMGSHKLSIWYCIILSFCTTDEKIDAKELGYNDVMSKFDTPGEKVRYTALLRALLNTGKKEATELLNTSKENLARDLYSVRTKNSARCPIVPSVDLQIDEIGIPTHIAYEMCREGFIKYLQNELNFTYNEARKATKDEAMNPETQKLFKEYAEKQVVLEEKYWYFSVSL